MRWRRPEGTLILPEGGRPLQRMIAMRTLLPTCFATSLLLFLVPAAGSAQVIEGLIREAGSGAAIDGALVVVLDERHARVAGTLSAADGAFRITLPEPGSYRVQAERIGYETRPSDPITVAAGETVIRTLDIPTRAISLEGVSVRAERRCRVRPEEGMLAATLWEEARKALEAAAFTERQRLLRYSAVRYTRELDRTGRVRAEESSSYTGYGDSPFAAMDVDRLLETGFVEERNGERIYYAPDAHTLVSDDFLDSYCFRGVEAGPDDPEGTLGLAFEPVGRRGGPAGISGTLWIDQATNELRMLEYTYLDRDMRQWRSQIGGQVEFRRLPTGAWMIPRWWIRMPQIEQRSEQAPIPGITGRTVVLAGIVEEGGEVTAMEASGGEAVHRALRATLSGEVFDSIRSAPIAGAAVYLDGTQYRTETDEDGRYQLEDLPDGEYTVAAHHPRFDVLDIRLAPRRVVLERGAESVADFATPSLGTLLAAECGNAPAAVVGRVHDAGSDMPLPGSRVVARWEGGQAATEARRDGTYRICDVPAGAEVVLTASFTGREGSPVELTAAGGPSHQDLLVGTADPVRLSGRLIDWGDGSPLANARLRLPRLDLEAVTDADGSFTFAAVPPGEHTLEIRHLGYGTRTETVEVARGEPTDLTIRLPAQALAIEGFEVEVRSDRERAARARGTRQDLFTREDIERYAGAGNVGDLARRFPGVTARPMFHPYSGIESGVCIEAPARAGPASGGLVEANPRAEDQVVDACRSLLVVVDGMPMPGEQGTAFLASLQLNQVESLEYLNPIESRSRFGGRGEFGALVIHTRGTGPHAERSR